MAQISESVTLCNVCTLGVHHCGWMHIADSTIEDVVTTASFVSTDKVWEDSRYCDNYCICIFEGMFVCDVTIGYIEKL